MMKKRVMSLGLVMMIGLSAFAGCGKKPFEAADAGIVTDGLVGYYDGIENTEEGHNAEAKVWKDYSGKGNDFTFDESEYGWSDKALQVKGDKVGYFPTAILDVTNSGVFTLEVTFGAFEATAYEYETIIAADNDEFSIFRRAASDILELKYNDANGDANRVKIENGVDGLTDSTVTYVADSANDVIKMYVDGELVSEGALSQEGNVADALFLGHDHRDRIWNGDVYSIRVYDRALTAEEVTQNAKADDTRYAAE